MNNDDITRRGLVLGGLALFDFRLYIGKDGGAAFIRARTEAWRQSSLPTEACAV